MSLKFKGDKPKKSKKRSHRELDEAEPEVSTGGTERSVKARYGKNAEGESAQAYFAASSDVRTPGWVLTLLQDDLVGPMFLTSKSSLAQSGEPLALCTNPINHKVYPFSLPQDMTAEQGEPISIDTIWRCARVPESDDKITLKSSQDRYLACNQLGEISAEREARGAEEEFILQILEDKGPGAYAVRSAAWGKYLGVDEVAGGKIELRCDSEQIGADEVWYCKMRAENLGKMEEERIRKTRKGHTDDGLVIIGNLKSLEDTNM